MLTAADGHQLKVTRWLPSADVPVPVAIQVLHGLGEHLGRYQRFAAACCERGFAVVGHNHRGHGEDCEPSRLGHFADRNGWNKVVQDAMAVRRFVRRGSPAARIVLLGHSMGSYIAQSVVARAPEGTDALILSASNFGSRRHLLLGRLLARLAIGRSGGREKSARLNQLGLGNFNRRFAPSRTAFDWLSRDVEEVDRYVADPLCGFQLSNRYWHDLLDGLLEITSLRTLRRIPSTLPILITGGEDDPVGGQRGQGRLARAYELSGHSNVALKLYPRGRHEMLHETNRDEFTRDVLDWIDAAVVDRR